MNDRYTENEAYLEEDSLSILPFILKYARYWRWFLAAVLVSLFIGFLYIRYAPTLYSTTAKVKIISESKQTDITSSVEKTVWGLSDINLENQIEVLKSYRLLQQVVADLNLDVAYFYVGYFKTAQIWDAPFMVTKFTASEDLTESKWYDVKLTSSGFRIIDEDDNEYLVRFDSQNNSAPGLPFSIELLKSVSTEDFKHDSYKFVLFTREEATKQLMDQLQVEPTDKKSDVLALSLKGESIERSETIINKTIEEFNQDGIEDKQAISKRTLDFIDERFIYLTGELDSIESGKQDFKQDNTLAYIQEDATTILKRKSDTEEELFDLETQLSLSRLLRKAVVKEQDFGLLPPDIGLSSTSINSLVSNYNELSREFTRLVASMPENHPTMKSLRNQLTTGKENILKTLDVNQRQLSASLARLRSERETAGEMFSKIPEKEKMLRAIERQQSIKENLFLLLLEKREEAAVNNAVTAPVIKVIDYAQSGDKPVSPRKVLVYPIALFLGLLGPFVVLFVKFSVDTKIHGRDDVEALSPRVPIMGEIPYYEDGQGLRNPQERSVMTESYRILCTNIMHTTQSSQGTVIFVTSSIKGEGKTSTAVNLATAFTSMKRKVLLIGADFRNPKLHGYFGLEKDGYGISDYVIDSKMDWDRCIRKVRNGEASTHLCLSGTKGINPPEILANPNFGLFIERAKKEYDVVIVDTAPMLLVSDTRLISQYADFNLFVLRVDFTDKRLMDFSRQLHRKKELTNMGYVINCVGVDRESDTYNYGYGYGYHAEPEPSGNKLSDYTQKTKRGLKQLVANSEIFAGRIFKNRRGDN